MPVTQMNHWRVRDLQREVEAALQAVADRHSLAVEVTTGRYDGQSFRPTVRFCTRDAAGIAQTPERASYVYACRFGRLNGTGLTVQHLDQTFMFRGHRYTVVGFARRASRNPIVVRRSNGRTYRMSVSVVARQLCVSPRFPTPARDTTTLATPCAPADGDED